MKASDFEIGPYDMCPCESGKKYKFCCAAAAKKNRHGKYPLGTVAFYGPDNRITTKIAASVFMNQGEEPDFLERWVATDVTTNPKILGQIKGFFARHGVKTVVMSDGNIGCPHEEGVDFKMGQDCPICHYWAGKQGTSARDDAFDDGQDQDFEGEDGPMEGSGEGFMTPEQQVQAEQVIEESLDRSDGIVQAADGDFDEACRLYAAHVKANMKLPMKVRLVSPFDWEEPYFLDGEEAGDEYEALHRKMPSMDDSFHLMKLDEAPGSADWSIYDGELGGWVVRISDGKGFSIGLGNLEPEDEEATTANADLLNDYGIWISDVNIAMAEQEGDDDEDQEEEEDGEESDGRWGR